MPARPLSSRERIEIRRGLDRGERDDVTATRLDRHRSTINAEINRNGGRERYCPVKAEACAVEQRRRPKLPRLLADRRLAAHVTKRLEAKDSPMTISIELAKGRWAITGSISHECIYQAIYKPGRGLKQGLSDGLHLRRRARRKRCHQRAANPHSLQNFSPIGTRPAIAAERSEVGHLEGDLIVGAMNRSAIITMFDRKSRYLWLVALDNKTADATYTSLVRALKKMPPHLRKTLTWDQGSEIARHAEIARRCGIDLYIADAKSPWQRPTNENGNGLVRRYVGKGTNLNTFSHQRLTAIQRRINTIPRRSLNWATANDIYTQAVTMTG